MGLYLQKKTSIRRISIGGKIVNHNYPVELNEAEAKFFKDDIEEVKASKKQETKKTTKKTTKK